MNKQEIELVWTRFAEAIRNEGIAVSNETKWKRMSMTSTLSRKQKKEYDEKWLSPIYGGRK